MEYFMNAYGMEIIGLILCAITGSFAKFAKKVWQDKMNTSTKREIAYSAFRFAEQVWHALKGPQKMQKALETAQEMLAKKGIDFDAQEMRVLIEVCVSEFNTAFKAPLDAPDSAEAVRRTEEESGEDCGCLI